jgi:hypothetical protein
MQKSDQETEGLRRIMKDYEGFVADSWQVSLFMFIHVYSTQTPLWIIEKSDAEDHRCCVFLELS